MKKSKIIIISCLIFVVLLFASAYLIYDSLFPKASPIDIPDLEQEQSIIVEIPDGTSYEDKHDGVLDTHRCILHKIQWARPTRIMSVNDYPTGEEYTKISCVCSDKTYTYYLYEKNGTTYLEVPYEGVYIVE